MLKWVVVYLVVRGYVYLGSFGGGVRAWLLKGKYLYVGIGRVTRYLGSVAHILEGVRRRGVVNVARELRALVSDLASIVKVLIEVINALLYAVGYVQMYRSYVDRREMFRVFAHAVAAVDYLLGWAGRFVSEVELARYRRLVREARERLSREYVESAKSFVEWEVVAAGVGRLGEVAVEVARSAGKTLLRRVLERVELPEL